MLLITWLCPAQGVCHCGIKRRVDLYNLISLICGVKSFLLAFPFNPLGVCSSVSPSTCSSSSSRRSTSLMLPTGLRSSCRPTPRVCSPPASPLWPVLGQGCWRLGLWAARLTSQWRMRRTTMISNTEVRMSAPLGAVESLLWYRKLSVFP